MRRFDQGLIITITAVTGVLAGLLVAAEYHEGESAALGWIAALGVVAVGYLARGAAFGLLLAVPMAYVALLVAGAEEPFADPGDSTAAGLLWTAVLVAALVALGNGLRWLVESFGARSSGSGGAAAPGA